MNKSRKLLIAGLCIVALLIGIILGVVWHRATTEQRIMEAYGRVNYSFGRGVPFDPRDMVFHPFEQFFVGNDFGINAGLYRRLRFYEHRGGVYLAYETVLDFFSEEFEPDGSLRLYNNGNHPEIQAFVEWFWEGFRRNEFDDYTSYMIYLLAAYAHAHADEGFTRVAISELSPQMIAALARAEADPDYVLDLTSLQQAGY